MFNQIATPANVFGFALSGKVTAADMTECKSALDAALGRGTKFGVCVDFSGVSDLTSNALAEGVKLDLDMLQHLDQCGRCALIIDKEWPGALVGMVGPLLPQLELKLFPSSARADAIAWAGEASASKVAVGEGAIRMIPTNKDDVLAFEMDGVIGSQKLTGVIKTMNDAFEAHDKVRLLGRIKHFGGIDPRVIMQGGLISMKLAAIQKVERYAIVGAPAWMDKIVSALNPSFPDIDMRTFSADREAQAWEWLGAKAAG